MVTGRGSKLENEYSLALGEVYEKAPKAVFAAVAVSMLTNGGDCFAAAEDRFITEWWTLYENGIVPQKPPFPKPPEEK